MMTRAETTSGFSEAHIRISAFESLSLKIATSKRFARPLFIAACLPSKQAGEGLYERQREPLSKPVIKHDSWHYPKYGAFATSPEIVCETTTLVERGTCVCVCVCVRAGGHDIKRPGRPSAKNTQSRFTSLGVLEINQQVRSELDLHPSMILSYLRLICSTTHSHEVRFPPFFAFEVPPAAAAASQIDCSR